jgi:NADPH:quinone reductase-like Zn-dependent oxidoreductase
MNTGDDIAGIVHSVGSDVYEFQPGDRVASFHEMMSPGGSYAEYAIGWQHTTFKIPKNVSFEGEHAQVRTSCSSMYADKWEIKQTQRPSR